MTGFEKLKKEAILDHPNDLEEQQAHISIDPETHLHDIKPYERKKLGIPSADLWYEIREKQNRKGLS